MSGYQLGRRAVLGLLAFGLAASASMANVLRGGLPFIRQRTAPPRAVDRNAGWTFFSPAEAAAVEAIVDRLIPADSLSIGGREAGCAIFIDRQLSGDYGRSAVWYLAGPRAEGTPQQGPQFTDSIADRYRAGLAALERLCTARFGNPFQGLAPAEQDHVLAGLDDGSLVLEGADGRSFFRQILKNTREGFFADPLYGGNKGMAGWKMIGFPGARYDYRAEIQRPGEDLGLKPVSMLGGDL